MQRNPHPKGVRALQAFIESLAERDPVCVANGTDHVSVLVRRARSSPPKRQA
jgi:hypothetical protein